MTELPALQSWLRDVAAALDVDASTVDITGLLDITREVAHSVARPAGPLTTFLIGLAVARRGGDAGTTRELIDVVTRLTQQYAPEA